MADDLRALARDKLGFEELRPGQAEVVEAVAGRDALAVMATGYGKSAIYQIAGLLLDGPTLVVSPLIALQRDQVERLAEARRRRGRSPRGRESEREEALEDARRTDWSSSSCRPSSSPTRRCSRGARRRAVADRGRRGALHLAVGPRLPAGVPAPRRGRRGAGPPDRAGAHRDRGAAGARGDRRPARAARPADSGLAASTAPTSGSASSASTTSTPRSARWSSGSPGSAKPGIVYTATRRDAERLAEDLAAHGVRNAAYHGGMARGSRDAVQEAFMADEIDVIVATTAFGMGVDKPNVRFVVHHAIADSVDSYWQEVGRAGRDGEPAAALLLYRAGGPRPAALLRRHGPGRRGEIERVADAGRHAPAARSSRRS